MTSQQAKIKLRATCLSGINVKMYGATGDAVTLDDAAISQAIAEAPIEGTVYFPAGNYVVSQEFVIAKRIKLIGDGPSTRFFQSNSGSSLF